MKRVIYLLVFAVIIAGIVFALWFLSTRVSAPAPDEAAGLTPPPGTLPTPPLGSGFPTIGTDGLPLEDQPIFSSLQKFGLVAQNPTRDYAIHENGAITLIQPDGQIVSVTPAGEATTLNSTPIADLASASFSPNGKFILAAFGRDEKTQRSIFDVAGRAWEPLPNTISEASWAYRPQALAYFISRSGALALETRDVSAKQPQELFRFNATDVMPYWANADRIMISEKPSARTASALWIYNMRTRRFHEAMSDANGLTILWNEDGTRGLAFETTATRVGGTLNLIDGDGVKLSRVTFLTLPSKCVFYEEKLPASTSTASAASPRASATPYLFCAIPRDATRFASAELPDAYEKRAIFTSDDFYRVNLADGTTDEVFADQELRLDASNLSIHNNRLFFVNRYDERVYYISLTEK